MTVLHNRLGIDHVTYGMFDFSLSFIIFLHMVFLVHLYSHSGQNSEPDGSKQNHSISRAQEAGYAFLGGSPGGDSPDGDVEDELGSFEMGERRPFSRNQMGSSEIKDEIDNLGSQNENSLRRGVIGL